MRESLITNDTPSTKTKSEAISAESLTIEMLTDEPAKQAQPLTLSYLQCKKSGNQAVDHAEAEDAPALLFLHGILGDARIWRPYLSAFPQYDCYALTLSGFGRGSEDETPFDTDRHGAEVAAFCQALNNREGKPHRQYIVIAWSYACHVALLSASRAPDLFAELILYELIIPSYGISEEMHQQFTRDIAKMMSPIIRAFRRNKEAEAIDHFIAACKNAPFSLKEQSATIQQIKAENHHTLNKLLTQKEPNPFTAEMLQALNQKVPITIFWGAHSRAIFQLSSKAAYQALQAYQSHNSSGGGEIDADHLLPEEEPEKLLQHLKDHLATDRSAN